MTSIVTGAAGFIGRALTSVLLSSGSPVVAIDRRPIEERPGLTVITADLLDVFDGSSDAFSTAFSAADEVYHLAGCAGVRDAAPGIAWRRHRDNVLAGARVLALTPPGVPLLVTSSSSVYGGAARGRFSGESGPVRPSVESDPVRPVGGYATSKVALERLCLDRPDVTIVRPFTVAGEGQRPDMALSVWLRAAEEGRPLRVLGSLDRTRDITDVRQAARAMIELIGVPGIVNLGTGHGQTLRGMAEAVATVTGASLAFDVVPAPPDEPGDSLADTRRLHSLLGWTPRTDLLDLVRRQQLVVS
ncbi:NAD(P)-dependent oxidoreductase [Nonomuraea sp. NEAU-A123]|uniref:NAD-dependent epimerase/dehydratase family protein n=1 Tax=Nonomuraea sp. NEAU-A123 TaxID=2839649 RepID=UPI001BE4715C|nr:NAD(P)-dependent oxidoreductase [Nonomuraea sp. NEAU-A123]MBT2231167.1 NAD(P)-dependent oxidoreductase [Nonomuraea sp. NEAU-A123]